MCIVSCIASGRALMFLTLRLADAITKPNGREEEIACICILDDSIHILF